MRLLLAPAGCPGLRLGQLFRAEELRDHIPFGRCAFLTGGRGEIRPDMSLDIILLDALTRRIPAGHFQLGERNARLGRLLVIVERPCSILRYDFAFILEAAQSGQSLSLSRPGLGFQPGQGLGIAGDGARRHPAGRLGSVTGGHIA